MAWHEQLLPPALLGLPVVAWLFRRVVSTGRKICQVAPLYDLCAGFFLLLLKYKRHFKLLNPLGFFQLTVGCSIWCSKLSSVGLVLIHNMNHTASGF